MIKVLITTGKVLKFIRGKRCQGKGDSFRSAIVFTNLYVPRTFNLEAASTECDRLFLFC